jgi:hypothetical protein
MKSGLGGRVKFYLLSRRYPNLPEEWVAGPGLFVVGLELIQRDEIHAAL